MFSLIINYIFQVAVLKIWTRAGIEVVKVVTLSQTGINEFGVKLHQNHK